MSSNPLVSIGVITYNSGKYVLETLESVKNQSYKNIELIISDDCSKDNTVELCTNWLKKNKGRFVDAKIVTTDHNTGISANLNRVVAASTGYWMKPFSGDDMLMPDATENYVNYVSTHENVQVVFAKMTSLRFRKDGSVAEEPFGEIDSESIAQFNAKTAREQYIDLLTDNARGLGGSPSIFVSRNIFLDYPFNEKYKGLDDMPQWIKLSRNGIHFSMMNEFTVKYRIGDSLTSSRDRFFSPVLWNTKHLFFWNELRDMLIEEGLYDTYNRKKKELLKIELLDCLTHNKPTYFNKIINVILSKLIKRVNFTKWY